MSESPIPASDVIRRDRISKDPSGKFESSKIRSQLSAAPPAAEDRKTRNRVVSASDRMTQNRPVLLLDRMTQNRPVFRWRFLRSGRTSSRDRRLGNERSKTGIDETPAYQMQPFPENQFQSATDRQTTKPHVTDRHTKGRHVINRRLTAQATTICTSVKLPPKLPNVATNRRLGELSDNWRKRRHHVTTTATFKRNVSRCFLATSSTNEQKTENRFWRRLECSMNWWKDRTRKSRDLFGFSFFSSF